MTFRDDLVQAVKDVGQEIIDRSEDIVGTGDLLSNLTIRVYFDPNFDMRCPTIEVSKEYIAKTACDRMNKGE